MSLDLGKVSVALLGLLAYKNRDKIGDLLRGNQTQRDSNNPQSGGGLLDGLLGGAGAGSGLQDILDRFRGAGSSEQVDSWVSRDANKPIERHQVETAIDPQTLDELSQQTGLTREQLIERITRDLPEAVDSLTPEGRMPETTRRTPSGDNLLDDVPAARGEI